VSAAPPISRSALLEAARWQLELEQSPDTVSEAFQHWLQQNAEHSQAWQAIAGLSASLAPLRHDSMVSTALGNLYGLPGSDTVRKPKRSTKARRRSIAGVLAAIGLGSVAWQWRRAPAVQWQADQQASTGNGERKQVSLADGSTLWLSARSAFSSYTTAGVQRIALERGELAVQTAAGSKARLVVCTAHGWMEALGTYFSVGTRPHDTVVNVFQGRVGVRLDPQVWSSSESIPARAIESSAQALVQAGEQLRFNAMRFFAPARAEPHREAWTRGVLHAEAMPLAQFAFELGQFHGKAIEVEAAAQRHRVVGRFPLDDLPRSLAMLQSVLPVRVQMQAARVVIEAR
jgi:transmembrane sensor